MNRITVTWLESSPKLSHEARNIARHTKYTNPRRADSPTSHDMVLYPEEKHSTQGQTKALPKVELCNDELFIYLSFVYAKHVWFTQEWIRSSTQSISELQQESPLMVFTFFIHCIQHCTISHWGHPGISRHRLQAGTTLKPEHFCL